MNVFVFVKYLKCVFVKLYMQTVFGFHSNDRYKRLVCRPFDIAGT